MVLQKIALVSLIAYFVKKYFQISCDYRPDDFSFKQSKPFAPILFGNLKKESVLLFCYIKKLIYYQFEFKTYA